MSENIHNKDLLSILKSKNDQLFKDRAYFDRTDTVSIASIQSSIFDFDTSHNNFENLNMKNSLQDENKKYPFKMRSFKFNEKIPENWLYSNPKQNLSENSHNPIEWMRTVFDENEVIPYNCKSNLKQTLSKSHANLFTSLEYPDETPQQMIISYKSVSDLKDLELSDNLKNNKDIKEDSSFTMTESKTAPGSVENVSEFRSSFQDFVALAKQQEEKLKAEVLKRKIEFNGYRSSVSSSKPAPSVRYIKNSRKSAPANRFGFSDSNQTMVKVTTRYSKPNNIADNNLDSVVLFKPKLSLQTSDLPSRQMDKFRAFNSNNFRQSVDSKPPLKLYHV